MRESYVEQTKSILGITVKEHISYIKYFLLLPETNYETLAKTNKKKQD